MMPVTSCIPFPFSTPCDDMLSMLVCTTRWLSMHLQMLAYMFMHESCLPVCHLCFNIMKLWTFDPNLHLSLANTTFVCFLTCLLSRLFDCFLFHFLTSFQPLFHARVILVLLPLKNQKRVLATLTLESMIFFIEF